MLLETEAQPISSQANVSAANVKARSAGRRQNRLHVQKAPMEFLLLGADVN
jgi:hypothetical protein